MLSQVVESIITVVLYIRVSSEEQAKHGYSLESQKARLLEYCTQKGYKVVGIYIDAGKTARSKLNSRKDMLRLLESAKRKEFNRVVMWKLDRWFRNVADYYKVQEILEANSIDWECSDEEYNTTTSSGRLYLNMRLAIAQNESDQTGDRIKFNFENMVKERRPIQGSHCMPLGYIVSGEKKNKRIVKDKTTEHIVDDMFEYFDQIKSVRTTLIYINEKYGLHICYDSMRKYLTNSLYTGVYRDVEGYCEPYITAKQFQKNKKNISRNVKVMKEKHDYIFSGLIKCRCCKRNMSGAPNRNIKRNRQQVYTYHVYRCNYAYNSKQCSNKGTFMETVLEKYLLENISDMLKNYIIEIERINDAETTNRSNISKEATAKKISRLNELYISGRISKEKYEKDYKIYTDELETCTSNEQIDFNIDKYKKLLEFDIIEYYSTLDNKSKRSFWAEFIDYIERDENKNFVVYFL